MTPSIALNVEVCNMDEVKKILDRPYGDDHLIKAGGLIPTSVFVRYTKQTNRSWEEKDPDCQRLLNICHALSIQHECTGINGTECIMCQDSDRCGKFPAIASLLVRMDIPLMKHFYVCDCWLNLGCHVVSKDIIGINDLPISYIAEINGVPFTYRINYVHALPAFGLRRGIDPLLLAEYECYDEMQVHYKMLLRVFVFQDLIFHNGGAHKDFHCTADNNGK